MFVLGGLGLLMGGCFGLLGTMTGAIEQAVAQQGAAIPEPPAELGMSKAEMIRVGLITIAVLAVLVSAAYILLGAFIRRGGRGASLTSALLTGLILVLFLMNLVNVLLNPRGGLEVVVGVGFNAVALALFGLLMLWAIQAFMNAPHVALARQPYPAPYWQYAQQQQPYAPPPPGYGPAGGYGGYGAYGQPLPPAPGGYGYAAPPPPQSPPLPPSPDSGGGTPPWDAARATESEPRDSNEPPPPGIG
jgi:hypothetical protein